VHTAAVDSYDRLWQEGRGQSHIACDLAADQFVELDVVGSGYGLGVAVVDLELRRRDLRVVLFVLEAHGPLHLGRRIDEGAQRIAGKRVIIAAGIDVLEFSSFVVDALGLRALEQETLDFIGGVDGVAVLFVQRVGKYFQDAADVGGIGLSAFVDDFAKDQYFAGPEDVGRAPVKCGPVNAQTQIALALGGEAANRRTVKGQVVIALQQELLVVIEHVQAAFEVAEHYGHSLDARLVGEVLQPVLLNFMRSHAVEALLLRLEIHLFEFVVGDR